MRNLFAYGPGIPRYLGMWLVLTPVLVTGLAGLVRLAGRPAFRLRPAALGVVVVSTLFALRRNPPFWLGPTLMWVLMVAAVAVTAAWLVATLRAADAADGTDGAHGADRPERTAGGRPDGRPESAGPARVDRRAVLALALLALALRVPLAWLDPGISETALATEIAARHLLAGANPWVEPNPKADVGTYQYPVGTPLAHLPLVAAVPDDVLGERHVGARAAIWLSEALTVAVLAWAGARAGHATGGLAAAFAYAVHPTLVREAGMTVANDLILAVLVVVAAVLFSSRRLLAGAVLLGLAASVKPPALLAVPVVLVAFGLRPALVAVAVPAALQAPFLLFPSPGLHGVAAMAEPATRPEPVEGQVHTLWWPLYRLMGDAARVQRIAAYLGLAATVLVALWAGRELRRRRPTLARTSVALALPLFASFALAAAQRTNYQDWHLAPLLLVAGLTARRHDGGCESPAADVGTMRRELGGGPWLGRRERPDGGRSSRRALPGRLPQRRRP